MRGHKQAWSNGKSWAGSSSQYGAQSPAGFTAQPAGKAARLEACAGGVCYSSQKPTGTATHKAGKSAR